MRDEGRGEIDRPKTVILLYVVFFMSGASALVFETLWFRLAGLSLGKGVWASAIVLSSFMGGLALGNGMAALWGNRIRNPLRVYAVIEILVAITGVSLVVVFPLLTEWLGPLLRPFLERPLVLNGIRVSMSFFLMLIPTTAMGMTLPLVVKALYAESPHFGQVLGTLYGWNTLGAVAGAILGETVLIQLFGLVGTSLLAAFFNQAAAFGALALSNRFRGSLMEGAEVKGLSPEVGFLHHPQGARLLLAGFLSGAALLALEVVWFRFLLLFVSSTSLVFSLMLSVVLAGIGLGGLLASWLQRWRLIDHQYIGPLALLTGIMTLMTYIGFDPEIGAAGLRSLASTWWDVVPMAFRLMFPVSLLSGTLFTLIGEALHKEIGREIETAGLLTMVNTIGAMVGPIVAGFVLLPTLGMERSFFVLALAYFGVAICTYSRIPIFGPIRYVFLNGAAVIGFACLLLFFPFGSIERHFNASMAKHQDGPEWERVALREGLTETLQYLEKDFLGEPLCHRLLTNGFAMSGTEAWVKRYMQLFVYLPVALQPNLKNALLICYGAGNTAKALTNVEGIESIDVVDISRDILEMSSVVYPDPTRNPLHDPRVQVHVEDGRFFLQTTDRQFDLITGEPPPPKAHGVVNLYTQEYFGLIQARLSDRGIVTYWLPVHKLKVREAKCILKAFCNVFEDCSLWTGRGLDWMMVGTKKGRGVVSEDTFAKAWSDPVSGRELRDIGLEKPEQLAATFIMDAASLREWTEHVPPLEDNFPKRLTDHYTGTREGRQELLSLMDTHQRRERFARSSFLQESWPDSLREGSLLHFVFQGAIDGLGLLTSRVEALREFNRVLNQSDLRVPILWMLGSGMDEQGILARAISKSDSITEEMRYHLGARAFADRDYLEVEEHLSKIQNPSAQYVNTSFLRIFASCLQGDLDRAEELARELDSSDPLLDRCFRWLQETFGLAVPPHGMKTDRGSL